MPNPTRTSPSGWITAIWLVFAVTNAVLAFTDGPTFWGWEFPDGLSGMLSVFCLFWALDDRESR